VAVHPGRVKGLVDSGLTLETLILHTADFERHAYRVILNPPMEL
jgi:hypothetical protein